MSYFMRFLLTDAKPVSTAELESALKREDPSYAIGPEGDLLYGEELLGQVTLNAPGDGLFEEELGELLEEVSECGAERAAVDRVKAALSTATATVAVQVLFQERDTEETLSRIDPLWAYLFAQRRGLLQTDGEGYYDAEGEVLLLD